MVSAGRAACRAHGSATYEAMNGNNSPPTRNNTVIIRRIIITEIPITGLKKGDENSADLHFCQLIAVGLGDKYPKG